MTQNNNGNSVYVQSKLGQDFIQINGHDSLIDDFEIWLRKQNNKTLYKRFRMRTPLKPNNQKQIVKKVKTAITRDCDRGLNIRIPQIRARHTSPMTTMRYNHKSIFDAINWIQPEDYCNRINNDFSFCQS